MNKKRVCYPLALATLMFVNAGAWAVQAQDPPGAQAAALEREAEALQADIDKECQKVAREARRLCRAQHAQAVQRLRARAARVR